MGVIYALRMTLSRQPGILQIFNRYLQKGGEEMSVDRIYTHSADFARMERCFFDSADWQQPGAPGPLGQLRRLWFNPDAARRFRESVRQHRPDVALLHNLYPVASPAIYRECRKLKLPAIQFIHNFRPFSPGGTLWNGRRVTAESLRGRYGAEIRAGTWQGSRLKTLLFSLLLKRLHAGDDLQAVRHWVAISDFMRDKFIDAGIPAERITTLRHSWDALPEPPPPQDEGYYLFLARLVEEKGLRPALQAWDLLRREMGAATPPLYVAGDGPLRPLVEAAAARNPSVRVLGFVSGEHKRTLLTRCRALLAPSVWWEPLGLVTYEAYDYAKPMLAAASGGLTETVEHGKTGFLHEPGNAVALFESVLQTENLTAESRHQLGAQGRAWLLAKTDPRQWKERFAAIVKGSVLDIDT